MKLGRILGLITLIIGINILFISNLVLAQTPEEIKRLIELTAKKGTFSGSLIYLEDIGKNKDTGGINRYFSVRISGAEEDVVFLDLIGLNYENWQKKKEGDQEIWIIDQWLIFFDLRGILRIHRRELKEGLDNLLIGVREIDDTAGYEEIIKSSFERFFTIYG